MQLCARCGPLHLKKVTPLSQQTPLKIEVLLSPPSFFENWVKGSTLQSPQAAERMGGGGVGRCTLCKKIGALIFLYMWSLQFFTWVPHEGVSPQHRYHLVIWYHTNKVFFSWGCFSPKQRKTEQKKERENSSWLALKLKFAVVLRYYE